LVFTNEHIDIVLLGLDDIGKVDESNVESADILASVIARLITAGDGGYGNNGWNNNGLVGAVLEHNAVAGGVVGLILEEHCRVKLSVIGGIAHSLSDLDLLFASA